jgi:hypothetical protein
VTPPTRLWLLVLWGWQQGWTWLGRKRGSWTMMETPVQQLLMVLCRGRLQSAVVQTAGAVGPRGGSRLNAGQVEQGQLD